MIIWLASYPRSGNTFFRLLLRQMYGLASEAPVDQQWVGDEALETGVDITPSGSTEMDDRFGMTGRPHASLVELIAAPELHIVKTHDLPRDDFPAIYLVRDGRDALISHAHFVLTYDLKLPPNEAQERFPEVLRMLIETDVSFGGWSNNVMQWTRRSSPTAVVKFEELVRSPLDCVRRAMHSVDFVPTESQDFSLWTFEQLHAEFPQFFRQGKQGVWREEMPSDLQTLFWERHGEAMSSLGYREDVGPEESNASSASDESTALADIA